METKVYCISVDDFYEYFGDEASIETVSDKDYIAACDELGWDLPLDTFVDEFNCDGAHAPTTAYHYIRIING